MTVNDNGITSTSINGNAIEFQSICKRFGSTLANDKVSFAVKAGEVHAIVGENGAGKTTLMRILYGLHKPDSGTIYVRGKEARIESPKDAIALGIGMVQQHFALIKRFTVAENIILGQEGSKFYISREKGNKLIAELSRSFDLSVDPEARIEELSVGEQQRVELLKVLYRKADIIILDEPTAVLTPQEIESLYATIERMKASGKTIIFITHKLKEVFRVADTITVMRGGRSIATMSVAEVTPQELSELIIGKELRVRGEQRVEPKNTEALVVENLVVLGERGNEVLKGLNLVLKENELLGIAGVEGNGQTELVEALCGLRRAVNGRIMLFGHELTGTPPWLLRSKGIAHIPEDRLSSGMIDEFTVYENLILGYQTEFSRAGLLQKNEIMNETAKLMDEYDIRPRDLEVKMKNLSGGNQQKVVIARELRKNPKVLIANQPTRGLDVGAALFVHNKLLEAKSKGSVLLISSDLDEIMELSDRIAVIYEGRIVGEFDKKDKVEDIGSAMLGGKGEYA